MAYDEALAERLRDALTGVADVTEKKMFGGLSFLVGGNLCVGVMHDGSLCARVGEAGHAAALHRPHAAPMVFTGRPMNGWITVFPAGFEDDADLKGWVARCLAHARSLPAKEPGAPRKKMGRSSKKAQA